VAVAVADGAGFDAGAVAGHLKRTAPGSSFGLVHFDAHADNVKDLYGVVLSHGTPMRRLVDEGSLRGDHIVQVGLRDEGPVVQAPGCARPGRRPWLYTGLNPCPACQPRAGFAALAARLSDRPAGRGGGCHGSGTAGAMQHSAPAQPLAAGVGCIHGFLSSMDSQRLVCTAAAAPNPL